MPDGKPRGPPGESSVGHQRASLAEPLRLQVAGRVKHLLHAGATLGAFVADNNNIAGLNPVFKNAVNRLFLAFEDPGRTGKGPDLLIDAGGLDDTTVRSQVAIKYGQAAVGTIGMFDITNTAFFPVEVGRGPTGLLTERLQGRNVAGCSRVAQFDFVVGRRREIPFFKGLTHAAGMDRPHLAVYHAAPVEFSQNAENAAGAVNIFHVVMLHGGSNLAEVRRHQGEAVDILHGKIDLRLAGNGQQVQDRVGRTAHGDIEPHGIFKSGLGRN